MFKRISHFIIILLASFSLGNAAGTADRLNSTVYTADSVMGTLKKIFLSKTDTPDFAGGDIQLTSKDSSIEYLGMIFGKVDYSLDKAEGTMGYIFRIFNIGFAGLATTIIIYSSVFGLSTTAHDGGAMGSNRFSPWSLARVGGSLTMLIPFESGYALIQVLVMKVVIAGVASANMLYYSAIDYVKLVGNSSAVFMMTEEVAKASATPLDGSKLYPEGGADTGMPKTENLNLNDVPLPKVHRAISDLVNYVQPCEENMVEKIGKEYKYLTREDLSKATIYVEDMSHDDGSLAGFQLKVEIPYPYGKNPEPIVIDGAKFTFGSKDGRKGLDAKYEAIKYSNAMKSYILSIANFLLTEQMQFGQVSKAQLNRQLASAVKILVKQIVVDDSSIDMSDNASQKAMKRSGWVSLGGYYPVLLKDGDEGGDIAPKELPNAPFELNVDDATEGVYSKKVPQSQSNRTALTKKDYTLKTAYDVLITAKGIQGTRKAIASSAKASASDKESKKQVLNNIRDHVAECYETYLTAMGGLLGNTETKVFEALNLGFDAKPVLENIRDLSKDITGAALESVSGRQLGVGYGVVESGDLETNPLIRIKKFGHKMVAKSTGFYPNQRDKYFSEIIGAQDAAFIYSSTFTSVKGAISAYQAHQTYKTQRGLSKQERKKAAQNSSGADSLKKTVDFVSDLVGTFVDFSQDAVKSILGIYLPFGSGLATVYLVAGVTLSAYVPFIPGLMFLFSVLAWLFAVIEAMIASPIILLGFTHPEGQDMLGKAEQALMLMLGVFLRPMLTVFGFLMSIILSYVAMKIFNTLFSLSLLIFMRSVFTTAPTMTKYSLPLAFISSGIVVLYSYAILVLLELCYSTIYVVPDQVLKWIGGPLESAGSSVSQAMREVSGGLTQHSQSASQGAGGIADSAQGITTRG